LGSESELTSWGIGCGVVRPSTGAQSVRGLQLNELYTHPFRVQTAILVVVGHAIEDARERPGCGPCEVELLSYDEARSCGRSSCYKADEGEHGEEEREEGVGVHGLVCCWMWLRTVGWNGMRIFHEGVGGFCSPPPSAVLTVGSTPST
jgi:hypothetical protein